MKPDALIVQDMAVLQIIKSMGLNLEIHSSVMMNVHNLDMIRLLENEGVTRVVLSREMSLDEVKFISERTHVELEYFTHGDMCITHGSQCYYSSLLFGMSSNRGRCLKPCRWWFDTEKTERDFPLAVKDLSLYRHLPEMIDAGVNTFKIEGRMREKAFITDLVNLYGDALDAYIESPETYNSQGGYVQIENGRKRNLSTGYAFGKPGSENINTRHEGTGKFYSTGKMFSVPTSEKAMDAEDIEKVQARLQAYVDNEKVSTTDADSIKHKQKLSVRVQTFEQAEKAIQMGVDRVYLAGDVYMPNKPFTPHEIKTLKSMTNLDQEVFITSPRMMNEIQSEDFAKSLDQIGSMVDGVLITQMGVLRRLKGHEPLKRAGDYSLNTYNSLSKKWYEEHGIESTAVSIEMNADQLGALSKNSEGIELLVYGNLNSMYFEHDFFEALDIEGDICQLKNEAGVFKIYKDQFGKTHLLTTHVLNLLPLMKTIHNLNIEMVRIEAQLMTAAELEAVISAVQNNETYMGEMQTLGALRF